MGARSKMTMGGIFTLRCYDKSTGELKWVEETHNIITNEGLDHILNCLLHAGTQFTTWYLTLSETNTTPLATHTYAVPGYTECTAYDETVRQTYVEAASSSQSVTNSANRAVFTMSATKTIYGAALVSFATKDDTAESGAVLLASGLFGSSKAVNDNDVLELQYTIGAADDA